MSVESLNGTGLGRVIHIVDDDIAVRASLRALLETYEYQVRTYASATEFLMSNTVGCSGCVITDLHMPGMNGLDLIEAMRRCCNTVPVVVLTGASDPQARKLAGNAGAYALLDKPVQADVLRGTIEDALAAPQHYAMSLTGNI